MIIWHYPSFVARCQSDEKRDEQLIVKIDVNRVFVFRKKAIIRPTPYTLAPYLALIGLTVVLIGRFLIATLWPNIHWSDEIFQTLEPGHRLVFGYGLISWEYRQALRSYLLPGALSFFIALGSLLGNGSYGYLTTVTLTLITLSLGPIWALLKTYGDQWRWPEQILVMVVLGAWYELIYLAPKALSEVVTTHLILTLLPFVFFSTQMSRRLLGVAGLGLAVAAGLRIQYLPAVGLIFLITFYRQRRGAWRWLIYGALSGLLVLGVVDWLAWGYPFQSLWANFYVQLIEGKSEQWGVGPWHFYLWRLWGGWAWAGLFIVGFGLIGLREAPLIGLVALAVLIPHMLVGHKEYRFVYLALFCILILAAFGVISSYRFLARYFGSTYVFLGLITFWLAMTILIGRNFGGWTRYQGVLQAYQTLSRDEEMCGLATLNVPWYFTGGYTYLHRNVPLFGIEEPIPTQAKSLPYNRAIIDNPPPALTTFGFFQQTQCWGATCLYEASIPCEAHEILYDRY